MKWEYPHYAQKKTQSDYQHVFEMWDKNRNWRKPIGRNFNTAVWNQKHRSCEAAALTVVPTQLLIILHPNNNLKVPSKPRCVKTDNIKLEKNDHACFLTHRQRY